MSSASSAYETWWQEQNRLAAYCPRCAKRYTRARPEWRLCLECTVNPQWATVPAGEFIAKAKQVFPGTVEIVEPVELGPEQLRLDEAA